MDVTVQGDLSPSKTSGYDNAQRNSNRNADPTKGPTFAEKLMGVRNSQCEHHLQHVQGVISLEESRRLERIREDTNRVVYDYKGMELERRRRELEEKKRRAPHLDTEEDEFELARKARYLFYNPNQCFYMDKKNIIPLRTMARSDPYQVTPTVARARKILQDMVNERHVDAMQEKRATMLSRKSARSVRFLSRDSDDEDNASPQHGDKASRRENKSQRRRKSLQAPQSAPAATRLHSQATAAGAHRAAGNEPSKQEALIAYLQRSKTQLPSSKFESLIAKEPGDDIPDDFTQCAPETWPKPHATDGSTNEHSKRSNLVITDSVDGVTIQTVPKPSSSFSRRSNALSENESEFRLPSISGDMTSISQAPTATAIGEAQDSVHFGTIEELPAHEVALLKQASQPLPPSDARPVKSAIVRRADTKVSVTQRRYTSTSANPIKRRQFTHAMLREEQAQVESKVGDFLARLDSGKRKPATRRMSMATVAFKAKAQHDTESANRANRAASPGNQAAADANKAEDSARTPRPRNPRGVPHHSQERSRRHTATFKLRRMVQELMRNRSTAQMMEYEKMRAAREAGAKTPDIRAAQYQDDD